MRISIARADLARLLASTIRVVEARNTIPILSTVRLVADGGKLTATATDLDIEVTSSVECQPDADGAVCVSASLIDSIVKKLPPLPDVALEVDGDKLTVKAGRYKSTVQTLPVTDFPSMEGGSFDAEFDVDLAALFAPVSFAMSNEETRFYLNGVYLQANGERMVAVATDGHRLGKHTGASAVAFDGIIVPRKMVGLVPKGEVHVALSSAKIRLTSGDLVITSKLVDGTFPDYERVIPKANDKLITFGSADMREAAGRVSVVSSERGRAVKVSIADGQAMLAVNNPESGSATEEIAVSYGGEQIDIGFNSAYLTELVAQFPAGDLTMALRDGGSPALFTSDKAPGLTAILMPMRV